MSKKASKKAKVIQKRFDVAVALKGYREGKNDLYLALTEQLRHPLEVDLLKAYLVDFNNCASFLDQHYHGFVQTILQVNWFTNETLCKNYLKCIVTLTVAQPMHLVSVLSSLVYKFKPSIDPSLPVPPQQRQYLVICRHIQMALKSIHDSVPMMPNVLMSIVSREFPYFKEDVFQMECYVRNLLQITLFMSVHRPKILQLIVAKMTDLDVSCPRHEILAAEKNESVSNFLFEMDIDWNSERAADPLMKLRQAEILDILMSLLLTYIKNTCYNSFENSITTSDASTGKLDWQSCKKLYRELLSVFDNIILPTHATCHVQFVMFYTCRFHIQLCDGFLDYLWKKFHNPNTEPIFRQACASYLGSFLARSKYLPISSLIMCLEEFCHWVHYYIDLVSMNQEKKPPYLSNHGPFYYLCQAVFYVFVFRARDILDSDKGINRAISWNFQRVVTCYLNPLKFCVPRMVDRFASVTRLYQLAMCDTIIEKNRREVLQEDTFEIAYLDKKCLLDSFFPFDPYLLTRSSEFIRSIYREYDEADSTTEHLLIPKENDEDDFLPKDVSSEDLDISIDGEFSFFTGSKKQNIIKPIDCSGADGSSSAILQLPKWQKNDVVEAMMASL